MICSTILFLSQIKLLQLIYLMKDFIIHLKILFIYFFIGKTFFNRNKIHSIIGVHSVYSYGLPLRIAINKNIKAYTINSREVSKITNKYKFISTNFFDYPKTFKKLSKSIKKGLHQSKKILQNRLSGKGGVSNHLISKISSFHSKNSKRLLVIIKKLKF